MAKRNNFVQTIKTIAQSLVNNAGYDKTRTGQIVGINEATMTYSVRVDGQTYNNVKAMDGNQYNLRDIVKVVIPCNQASQIYISSAAYSDNTLGNRVAYAQSVADEAMTFIEEELPEELQSLRDDLEEQIDGKIETWAQDSNPATSWATSTLKAEHDGDLWYFIGLSDITVDGVTIHPSKTYQYQYNSSTETGTWVQYNSPSRTLFDLADGKTTIFYGSTSGTYANVEANDYLVDSTTGCTYQYNGSGWIKVTDYQTDIATAVGALEADLEAQIDAKIETWTQTEDPSSAWTTTELKNQHNGDLWFYIGTTNSTVNDSAGNPVAPSKTYQYNSSTNKWVLYNSPNKSLFDLADGKSTIFYGTPSSFSSVADVGDVCINPNDHNKAYRWDGSSWNFVGGGDPINTATITLYQRASSTPSAPSGGQTYTFETGVLNPIPSGWSRDIPSGSNPCYITQTNVTSVNASVTISSWSTPVMFVQDGIDAPTAVVSITVDTISYLNNTATLRATLFVDGAVKTPIIYAWTKGTSTTVVGTNVTLGITDLDAVYNCVVTWSD